MSVDVENRAGRQSSVAREGVLAGLIAYLLWGVFPVYFKLVDAVAPLEVVTHRVIWSVPFGALIILFRSQLSEVWRALRRPHMVSWLALSATIISVNWFIYIWAVQEEQIFQASLGYYINPLMYVLVGVIFLRESLRHLQAAALLLAAVGVLILTVSGGKFPLVALALATSFTIYGVIRKKVVIGGMPGLFIETALLLPFALAWFGWLLVNDRATFASSGSTVNALLVLAGPLTVVPLLFFALAARRLTLSSLGFMQFIAPTLQFFTGLYYGEQLTTAHLFCFGFIWLAAILFSVDAVRYSKRNIVPSAR